MPGRKLDIVQVQQWLSDISATRGEDGLNDGLDQARESYDSFLMGLSGFEKMFREEGDSEGMSRVEQIRTNAATCFEIGNKMAQAYIDGGPEAGNKLMGDFDSASSNLSESLDPLVQSQTDELNTAMNSIVSATGRASASRTRFFTRSPISRPGRSTRQAGRSERRSRWTRPRMI